MREAYETYQIGSQADLQWVANRLRLDVMEMIHQAGDGHPGPCMSIAELMAVLYFEQLRLRPEDPRWPQRDRFILSKGHACPILYAALARRGFFPPSELPKLRSLGGMLQGHPDIGKTPGVDSVSGSLGNGLAVGLGMALAGRMQSLCPLDGESHGEESLVYVVLGDGEMEEGVVWEGAMAAAHHKAGNLIAFGDCNGHQSGGKVSELSSLYPLEEKWAAFHWHVQSIDGHHIGAIRGAIQAAKEETTRPSMILMNTVKGRGIPFMEHNNAWHKRTPTAREVRVAEEALFCE